MNKMILFQIKIIQYFYIPEIMKIISQFLQQLQLKIQKNLIQEKYV